MNIVKCQENNLKICPDCNIEKLRSEFYWQTVSRSKDTIYQVSTRRCRLCHNKYVTKKLILNRAKFLYRSYRNSDHRKGFFNDLTEEMIREIISNPCSYCGGDIQMGLDRKDNSAGHCVGNIVPCCVRCNHIKSNMPIKAWEIISEAVKQAYIDGAFGNWKNGSKY